MKATYHPNKMLYRLCYPTKEMFRYGNDETRVCMYIHKRLDGITKWMDAWCTGDSRAEDLQGIMDEFRLTQHLNKGTITWRQDGRNCRPPNARPLLH